MKRLLSYIRPYKTARRHGRLRDAHPAALATSLQPYLPGLAFDAIPAGDANGLTSSSGSSWRYGGGELALELPAVYQMTCVGQYALYDVASDMFQHIAQLSLSFFDRNETGPDHVTRPERRDGAAEPAEPGSDRHRRQRVSRSSASWSSCSCINWRLALLTSHLDPGLRHQRCCSGRGFARQSFRRARATISVVNASLQENVSGVRVIQSLGREGRNSQGVRASQLGQPATRTSRPARIAAAGSADGRADLGARRWCWRCSSAGAWRSSGASHPRLARLLHALHRPLLRPDSRDHAAIHPAPARHGRRRAHLRNPRHEVEVHGQAGRARAAADRRASVTVPPRQLRLRRPA